MDEGYGIQLSTNSTKILNLIGFENINKDKIFNPKGVDFYNIKNKKIYDLDLTQFNTEQNKYTTLQRSTLIEFLKDEIYTQHLRFGKNKGGLWNKRKSINKFEDNTNDLVDLVVAADGIFSNTRSFFEKKKNEPKFKKAIAVRSIIKLKHDLNIDEDRISLMMGKNCHLVIYPINKNKELNLVCVIRDKQYDPSKSKSLVNKVIDQTLPYKRFLILI